MSTFDPAALGRAIVEDAQRSAKPALVAALVTSRELRDDLAALQTEFEETLAEIQNERDPARLALLQKDAATILPARRLAILSAAESRISSDAKAALDVALDIAVRVAVIMVKSFV